jgi:stearoyl-CoA desaturase (delta-9 desaturase)
MYGTRRFVTEDESRNNWIVALVALGEGWHHNHHAFPRSAVHGLKRRELDPSAAIIAVMEKLGLARNVVRISAERQAERMQSGPAAQQKVAA